MKNILLFCCIATSLFSCKEEVQYWEYKVVKVAGQDAEYRANFGPKVYGDQTSMLNTMGKNGWELVNTYTEIGTAFPNFGNEEYVTGLRENTRTTVLNFVFKRKSQATNNSPKTKKK